MFNSYKKALVTIGLVFCLFSTVFAYSGGTGEPNSPYQIASVSDWNDLMHTSSDWNKHFIMTADLNLQGVTLIPVGGSWPDFTGVFDGNGHIIRHANINIPNSWHVGLFGYVDGQIRNLGVEDVNINGYCDVGSLAGYNNGTIATCYATGSVNGNEDVGGLVGLNGRLGPTITDCYATATVTGNNRVGGLAGSNYNTITNCYAIGSVNGNSNVGGLVGYTHWYRGRVIDSFWDTQTSGMTTSAGGTGKTTAQMKTRSTFTSAGWDFFGETTNGTEDVWTMCEGISYPKFTWQNQPPIANAGPDQTVYAWIDGVAEAELDGLDSNDPDCNELTYYWSWTIDGITFEANGVNPTILLPVGVHTIQLIVNDGIADSIPDDVNITVIAPLKGKLQITPCVLNRDTCNRHKHHHKPAKILAIIRLPEGIARKDIDNTELLTIYPGGIKAQRQWIFSYYEGDRRHRKLLTAIWAYFDKNDILDAIPANGKVELKAAGKLKTGQYFYGCDTVRIIAPPKPRCLPKK